MSSDFDISKIDGNFFAELDNGAVLAGSPRHFRNSPFIRTFSGRRFYPMDPWPQDVSIEDIAQSLSQRVRWTGHCNRLYTVATHSLRVGAAAVWFARQGGVTDECTLALIDVVAKLHDGAEAYLPDIASPLKSSIPNWNEIEGRVQTAIHLHFGLEPEYPELKRWVKAADLLVLWLEKLELFSHRESIDSFFSYLDDKASLWPGFPECPVGAVPPARDVSREEFQREIELSLETLRAKGKKS